MQTKIAAQSIAASLLLLLLSACSGTKVKPELPCRTVEQLKQALNYALNANDTNLLWQLYSWTNVSPSRERFEKKIQLQFHPENPGDKSSFKSFRIVTTASLPQDLKELAECTNPAKPQFNIPIQGIIFCDQKMRKGGRSSSFERMEFPFGQTSNGTYAVAVLIKLANTNTPATSPSASPH